MGSYISNENDENKYSNDDVSTTQKKSTGNTNVEYFYSNYITDYDYNIYNYFYKKDVYLNQLFDEKDDKPDYIFVDEIFDNDCIVTPITKHKIKRKNKL